MIIGSRVVIGRARNEFDVPYKQALMRRLRMILSYFYVPANAMHRVQAFNSRARVESPQRVSEKSSGTDLRAKISDAENM